MQSDSTQVFISYSRKDSEFALKLSNDLKNQGVNTWLDQTDIPGGAEWDNAIEEALEASGKFLIILTKTSVTSSNVKDELNFALQEKKQVIPILLEDCRLPMRISRRQFVDFSKSYETGLNKLLVQFNKSSSNVDKTSDERPRATIGRRKFIAKIGVVGVVVLLLSYFFGDKIYSFISPGVNPPPPDPKPYNPRFKKKRPKFTSDKFKNTITINRKSGVFHYFDSNGYTISAKDFASRNEFIAFEKNLAVFPSSDEPVDNPRLAKGSASWTAEKWAAELLKNGELRTASKRIIRGLQVTTLSSRISYRLFDLLAIICVRHPDKVYETAFEYLKQLAENSGDMKLIGRAKNWSEKVWKDKILENDVYFFDEIKL